MESFLAGLKIFFTDSNNQKFLLGLLALVVLFYILKGETGTEKFQRFFKVILFSALFAFLYALYYFFIKN